MMDVLSGVGTLGVPLLVLAGLILLAIVVVVIGRAPRRRRGHGLVAGHRLAVVDQVQIDDNRRLVLIQRDDVQHLVILGGGSDLLVESGIGAVNAAPVAERPRPVAREPEPVPASAPVRPRPAPESAAPEYRGAEPRPALDLPTRSPLPARRTPATSAGGETEIPSPLPPLPRRAEPAIERPAPAAPPETGPRTTVKVDPAFAGMVEQLEETLRRPITSDIEAARRAPPVVTPSASAPAVAAPTVAAPIAPSPAERPAPPVVPPRSLATPVVPAVEEARAPSVAPEPRVTVPSRPVEAPEVRPTEPRLSDEPEAGKPEGNDAFEEEMASLLGRAKRP